MSQTLNEVKTNLTPETRAQWNNNYMSMAYHWKKHNLEFEGINELKYG